MGSTFSGNSKSSSTVPLGNDGAKFYAEDTVQSKVSGEIGLVVYVEGDTDSQLGEEDEDGNEDQAEADGGDASSDASKSDKDDQENENDNDKDNDKEDDSDFSEYSESQEIPKGYVSVYWPKLKTRSLVESSTLTLLDRSFLVGDVCTRPDDPNELKGLVMRSRILCDLKLYHNGEVICGVDSSMLKPIQPYRPDSYATVPAGYIYRIEHCASKVKVLFPQDLVLEFMDTDDALNPIEDDEIIDGCLFFPTQKVDVAVAELVSRNLIPSGKYWTKKITGTVQEVTPIEIETDWRFDCHTLIENEEIDEKIGVDQVILMNHFSNTSFSFGDRVYLHDEQRTDLPNNKRTAIITKTRMVVDICWQDRTISEGVDTTTLLQCENVLDHEFWPGDYVTDIDEKFESDGYMTGLVPKKFGYVYSSNPKDRTCCVRWLIDAKYEASQTEPVSTLRTPDESQFHDVSTMKPLHYVHEEVVSTYDIKTVYECEPGDIVVRLGPDTRSGGESDFEQNLSGALGRIGEICGFHEGQIHVKWADETFEWTYPQQLLVLQMNDEGSADGSEEEEDEDEELSSESDESERVKPPRSRITAPRIRQREKEKDETNEDDDGWESCSDEEEDDDDDDDEDELPAVETHASGGCLEEKRDSIETQIESSGTKPDTQPEMQNENAEADCGEISVPFAILDETPSDHHFLSKPSVIRGRAQFSRKIQEDYNLLQTSLPPGIAVRAFGDRMDLMRAVIVGPKNTPYQDVLFFFDLFLSDYPNSAPSVFYHPFCPERLNPNLYETGNVCLSILGTWHGSSVELWNPKTSNILRILVSIQGLVLVSFPYYNEAGYDKQRGTTEGHKNSLMYNETATLLTIRSIIGTLQKPPQGFEELTKQHYRKVRETLLRIFGDLKEGITPAANPTQECIYPEQVSPGFCASLRKLFPVVSKALGDL